MFDFSRLKNCPNCGATLNDTGRCEYCGSKVYDLTDIDLRSSYPFNDREITYLRIRTDQGIIVVPVVCDSFETRTTPEEEVICCDNNKYIIRPYLRTISMEFTVIGDYIEVKEEKK